MSIFWTGSVTPEGRLDLDDVARFRVAVKALAGKRIELTLDERRRRRSHQQNKWLRGVALPAILEKLGDELGYDRHEHAELDEALLAEKRRADDALLDRIHYDLLSVRFGTVPVAPLVPQAPPRIVPAKTSSDLTTTEFSEYMEWLVRYAAQDLHVVIALPDEVNAW